MPNTRKRTVITSSDGDASPSTPKKSQPSIQAAFLRAGSNFSESPAKKSNGKSTPGKSPTKKGSSLPASQSNTPTSKTPAKTKPIHSFFNAAIHRQQSNPDDEEQEVQPLDLEDDGIQDFSDDSLSSSKAKHELNIRKRKIEQVEDVKVGNGSIKFLRPTFSLPSELSGQPSIAASDNLPWTDLYRPIDFDELAVHKRKVQDVREWISKVISGSERKRLLVLRGGAGTGKTTTIKLLCQQMGINITEWNNPDSNNGAGSIASQFDDFVRRTCSFGTLALSKEPSVKIEEEEDVLRERIVLVEEFPNTYSTTSSTLQGFRRAVLQYLASTTPSADDFFGNKINRPKIVPVIMVISESLLTTSTASADSFTAHRLLGPEILSHVGTTVVEFNPIAPTFMAKALDLVLRKEAKISGRRHAPGTAILKHLSETGDIRSAVSALQFFCVFQGKDEDWSGKINITKAKKSDPVAEPTQMERRSLEMITQRENTLGIFHAVGKVVYNKREPADKLLAQPPSDLPHFWRPNKSEVDADSLLNELGTEVHIFVAALHENYALSCGALSEDETLDSLNGCIDSLSDADLLAPERFSHNLRRFSPQSTATDALRQDDIGFFTAVLGLLFNLPYPVKRLSPPMEYVNGRGKTYSKNTAFQMMYPTSERLWRQREQIHDLLSMFREKFRNGDTSMIMEQHKAAPKQGVDAWRKAQDLKEPKNDSEAEKTLSLVRCVSFSELLLERLPYVARLQKRKGFPLRTNPMAQNLQKVVNFSGVGNALAPEDEDGGNDEIVDEWSTDKPTDENQPWRKAVGMISKNNEGGITVRKEIENLVLSDDDIEDD